MKSKHKKYVSRLNKLRQQVTDDIIEFLKQHKHKQFSFVQDYAKREYGVCTNLDEVYVGVANMMKAPVIYASTFGYYPLIKYKVTSMCAVRNGNEYELRISAISMSDLKSGAGDENWVTEYNVYGLLEILKNLPKQK